MSNKRTLVFLEEFLKEVKRLRKKYRHIEADIKDFADQLEAGETLGERLQGTKDYEIYKARVASRDMQRGKSGGFRIIYYLQTDIQIYMLTVYAKTEKEDISALEVLELINEVLESLEDDEDTESSG
jgi:mRNA-degrading endonuclease RelE of RelBE toxin-antitoxin system